MGEAPICRRELRDGRADGLQPLQSLDLSQCNSFSSLVRAMRRTAFGGRQLGEALDVLTEMTRDPACTVILTLSGAMTVAKQGRIICDLIDQGIVSAVVATGALIAHGLTESLGLAHYSASPNSNDAALFELGYNRIYDTLELESNLNEVERLVAHVLRSVEPEGGVWSSSSFCKALGEELDSRDQGPGILRSAWRRKVPLFIPAFTDSEIGLDFATFSMSEARSERNTAEGGENVAPDEFFRPVPPFNPFLDLQRYARLIGRAKTLGILTVGGGVPRNWAQQVGPYYDIAAARIGVSLPAPRFRYGVRICPEPVHWGGLSGCTYAEGVSWGKFFSPEQGGRFAEVYADATTVFPLLIKALLEERQDTP